MTHSSRDVLLLFHHSLLACGIRLGAITSKMLAYARYLTLLLMMLVFRIANADEVSDSSIFEPVVFQPKIFKVHGFATLGTANSSEDQADFVDMINLPKGAGYSHNWSFNTDSRIGLQIDAVLTDNLYAVMQVQSKQNYDDSYTPKVEWANLNLQLTPQLKIGVGRFGIPFFMASDSLNVGYAQPWLRVPTVVYYFPISELDGVNVNYQYKLGEALLNVQTLYGHSNFKFLIDGTAAQAYVKNFSGAAFTAENGNSTIRLSYFLINHGFSLSNSQLDGMFNLYRTMGMSALANQYEVKNHSQVFTGLGYSYVSSNWMFQSEITKLRGDDDITPSLTSWYTTLGRHYGKIFPYITLGESTLNKPSTIGGADPLGAINAALAASNFGQHMLSIGTRWDFANSMDLKVQVDRINLKHGSNGGLANLQPGFKTGGSYNLLSFSVDVVF
ncbi:MAG: hypothetical protein H7Z73_02855 [Candidatus Saccharibacteria bacterium]|nr:hypothetical protein [Moraxellaceae bacterium]